jgi:hypothetical protein
LRKTHKLKVIRTVAVLLLTVFWSAIAAWGQTDIYPVSDSVDRAFNRLYSFDFAGSQAIIDAHIQAHPEDALAQALRGAVHLFSEFQRLNLLETDFFLNDDKITDKKRLKPDPAARSQIFSATEAARKTATARLAQHPEDPIALFALCMAAGLETEYTVLVEKKYLRSYGLSKETQGSARKLLALNPPFYDAYVTLGSAEYIVSNLNFFFRIFVHFDNIKGSRQSAIENLKKAIDGGRFYQPYAKILLTVVYLREKRPQDALLLMRELERDFPENPLFKKESAIIAAKLAAPK